MSMYEQVTATLSQAVDDLQIPTDAAALKHSFALLDRFPDFYAAA